MRPKYQEGHPYYDLKTGDYIHRNGELLRLVIGIEEMNNCLRDGYCVHTDGFMLLCHPDHFDYHSKRPVKERYFDRFQSNEYPIIKTEYRLVEVVKENKFYSSRLVKLGDSE